jgi:hypothetical protein
MSGSSVASSSGRLNPLQIRVLDALAEVEPRFVLSGGGALAGVHLGHRTTRDLDLFWRNASELGSLPELTQRELTSRGLSVKRLQRGESLDTAIADAPRRDSGAAHARVGVA